MARIVMLSKSNKLVALLSGSGFDIVATTDNQYELSRQIRAFSPQIVIIDSDVSNVGAAFVNSLIFDQQAVLLIGKAHQRGYYQPSPYLEFVDKPLQPSILLMTLRLLSKYAVTVRQLESKISKLEERQKNEKLVGQAKRKLQQESSYSEEEAHQYMQRRSMELRISKAELARRILTKFEKKT